jgi:outer membrane biogenesis lipoprotein LolB
MPRPALPTRFLLWAALSLLAAGCAAPRPAAPPSADEARAVYKTFLANQAKNDPAPAFSLAGSLSFARGSKSGRLNYRFYGNLKNPVRLDLTTPMGGAYAHLREDGQEFAAYVPGRNTVYRHADAKVGASRLGMPLPFTLRELAAIVSGRFGELAPAEYTSAKKTAGGYEYAFSGDPRLSSLTLDFEGKPRHLTGRGVEPWRVVFEEDEPAPGLAAPVARKLTLTTPGGASLTLRVKSLQSRPTPYPAADLELPVPSQADNRSLDTPGDGTLLPEL